MFTTNPVANTVSTLRNAYQAKKLFVELPYCRAVSQLVCRLRDIGYIQHYVIRSTSHSPQAVRSRAAVVINPHRQVRLYLKYVECAPVFGDLRCYWYARSRITIRLGTLRALASSGSAAVLLIATDRGLLTSHECVKFGLGGILVCALYGFLCVFQFVTPLLPSVVFLFIKIFLPMTPLWVTIWGGGLVVVQWACAFLSFGLKLMQRAWIRRCRFASTG